MIAQRTLSFIPGDWDEEAIESGKGSNEFRQNIEDVYIKEYMGQSPLIGNGFNINTAEFQYYQDAIKSGGAGDVKYLQAKIFIEGKMFHTGWISVYDCVGGIGTIAFVVFGLNEIRVTSHFIFGPKADRRSTLYPLYVWIMCQLVTVMISYFTVFGSFQDTFMGLLIYGILLSHLVDVENITDVPVALRDRKALAEFGRLSDAQYGYRSRP
jgi:hypothetical protein